MNSSEQTDVILIGAGIMSATLGVMLKELEPNINIKIFERLSSAAAESSDAWNNAGTGHSAFCELNYTPELKDGTIETVKAVKIAESFEETKQFWSYLVKKNFLTDPEGFIKSIPHISFVWGDKNVNYLHKRFEALKKCHLFKEMVFSDDKNELEQWMPLVMDGRDPNEKVAATKMEIGTDVNFGALTKAMFARLQTKDGVTLEFDSEVRTIRKSGGSWALRVKNKATGERQKVKTKFVFIGAGGGSLPLLEKSNISEGKGFGGFPVSGQWLRCNNEEVIKKHAAKVYGKASVGSPPMSVPHLDSRMIDGKKELLFGPYAGFSTKFLKEGSYMDLITSIQLDNILPMMAAGMKNIPLTKYLIDQVRQSPQDRLNALKEYLPEAKMPDWVLETAGQRVQVIKKDPVKGGVLEFGTEVVSAADGSIAALLGASPGASTAVSIMLDLLKRCFKDKINSSEWQAKLQEMIPSYGHSLGKEPELAAKLREETSKVLGLTVPETV